MLFRSPRTGERYQVAKGLILNPQWISPSEFIVENLLGFGTTNERIDFERVTIKTTANRVSFDRDYVLSALRMIETPGESYTLTPDGRIVYSQAPPVEDARFFRVVPNWVEQMKRAVDEVNR